MEIEPRQYDAVGVQTICLAAKHRLGELLARGGPGPKGRWSSLRRGHRRMAGSDIRVADSLRHVHRSRLRSVVSRNGSWVPCNGGGGGGGGGVAHE